MITKLTLFLSGIGSFLAASVLPAAIIFAIGVLLIRIVINLVTKLLDKSKLEKAAHKLIKTAIRVVLYGLLALIVASKLGIDVTCIVALASVLTLAISLSVHTALPNVISGFTLLYTKPFASGDYVEVAGQSGSVNEIGLTYTKLTTPDNNVDSIPNSAVTSAQIVNYTVLGKRRVDVAVSASYDSPIQLVLETLREAGNVPTILDSEPVFAAVDSYGESTVNYVLRVWSTADDYWTTLFVVNENIKKLFDEKGVTMTYPHLNVHLDK